MKRFLLISAASLTLTNSQVVNSQANVKSNAINNVSATRATTKSSTCQRSGAQNFLVFSGGGAPSYNEIALEKNVLYFQRSLRELGYNPSDVPIYFANGNTGEKTVRFINEKREEAFKAPEIPFLDGASSVANVRKKLQGLEKSTAPLFFYFTGHGGFNRQNHDNSTMLMWRDQGLTVQNFTQMLDRLPQKTPFVTMMSQCYSGSFANVIYRGGDPRRGIALQTRCGFFATIKTNPSVGCTPEVNEADYRDYSSSFFAGLTGRDRIGRKVRSADYNQDGRVSYSEAHAYAKIDKFTTDLPISTSEAWLQRQVNNPTLRNRLLDQSIAPLAKVARPEQRHVINTLSQQFKFDVNRSFLRNVQSMDSSLIKTPEDEAYVTRLAMELVNVGMEQRVKSSKNQQEIEILNRLIKCESGSWGKV